MRSDPPLSRRQTAASQDLLTNFGKQLRLLPRRILPLLGASSVACLWVGKSLPRWLRDRSGEFSYEQFVLFSANRIHRSGDRSKTASVYDGLRLGHRERGRREATSLSLSCSCAIGIAFAKGVREDQAQTGLVFVEQSLAEQVRSMRGQTGQA